MTDKDSFSIINVGDITGLSKPVTVLIEKVSAAFGILYQPTHTVRQAKADVKVAQMKREITAESEALLNRANNRADAENLRSQRNIESTLVKATKVLPPDTPEESIRNMDEDWIVRVLEDIRMVSDESMQLLWAKVVAGEAGKSGSFSKKTVRIVADMSKEDAEMFTHFCRFVASIYDMDNGDVVIVNASMIYDVNAPIYDTPKSMFEILDHLSAVGLLSHQAISKHVLASSLHQQLCYYNGRAVQLSPQKEHDGKYSIDIGYALFTKAGEELFPICGAQQDEEFFSYLMKTWAAFGYDPTPLSEEEAATFVEAMKKQSFSSS